MEEGLEQCFQALPAGGLHGADFRHAGGELLLQSNGQASALLLVSFDLAGELFGKLSGSFFTDDLTLHGQAA